MGKIIIPEGMDLLRALQNDEYICNNCGAIMDCKEDPEGECDILECPNCGETEYETEYEYEYDDEEDDIFSDEIPQGCAACGGPYPQCTTSCKLFDD